MTPTQSRLFRPLKVGNIQLQHRVVLAPCTRMKATLTDHVAVTDLVKEYYSQRASVPGTLLISEGVLIAPEAGPFSYVPGFYTEDQIAAWKEVVEAVHKKGSFIFLQLGAIGRIARPATLESEKWIPLTGAGDIPISTYPPVDPPLRPLTKDEIKKYVGYYAAAARNAVRIGFDGVEVHAVYGFLVDQFLQDVTNNRMDEYGGSIENRSRFALEVMDAIVKEVGAERAAIRISPWSTVHEMRMKDPKPQFTHLVSSLANTHPNLAYLHVVEPLPLDQGSDEVIKPDSTKESNDFIREIWAPRPLVACGFATREDAIRYAEEKESTLAAFGRSFIANPDLPYRLQHDVALTKPDEATLYIPSDHPAPEKGYIDYPFSEGFLSSSVFKALQD